MDLEALVKCVAAIQSPRIKHDLDCLILQKARGSDSISFQRRQFSNKQSVPCKVFFVGRELSRVLKQSWGISNRRNLHLKDLPPQPVYHPAPSVRHSWKTRPLAMKVCIADNVSFPSLQHQWQVWNCPDNYTQWQFSVRWEEMWHSANLVCRNQTSRF